MTPQLKTGDKIVIMPDGQRVNLAGTSYAVSGSSVVFTFQGGGTYTYAAGSSGAAQNVLSQVDAANSGTPGLRIIGTGALVWTSITPDTASVGFNYVPTVAGSGFLNQNFTNLKLDDGSGHAVNLPLGEFTVSDDENIILDLNTDGYIISYAGTYTLYFSTDGGATWTSTTLTITAS
jgi:hypothetical protein